eukprot:CAMPEP_0170182484 /NCGR_PEP_ID=MMETSP0040_2-20121228/28011_1 /TAXON_ID=641309 /ORGANISM="Lotharella oceanica, Strain CCMP622" /LENGTH=180 /DNA_ID=CAMNT_0010427915 /DNA_START=62 /DNA_END=605 /DNA_ORIENTATION=-
MRRKRNGARTSLTCLLIDELQLQEQYLPDERPHGVDDDVETGGAKLEPPKRPRDPKVVLDLIHPRELRPHGGVIHVDGQRPAVLDRKISDEKLEVQEGVEQQPLDRELHGHSPRSLAHPAVEDDGRGRYQKCREGGKLEDGVQVDGGGPSSRLVGEEHLLGQGTRHGYQPRLQRVHEERV